MTIQFKPIGVIRSPIIRTSEAPRQPHFGKPIEATAELEPGLADGLDQLEGFDRLWLLAWLHQSKTYKLQVRPPGTEIDCGVFASRAPHRPNPIALSCVRLIRITDVTLHLAEVDLLDGTPLLDIKPYAPQADCYPNARACWLDRFPG
jgi:tRNA-Thr(GGU) m(6)t(6)A37 methyltransferase TsaA